jgi:hypothetical protein
MNMSHSSRLFFSLVSAGSFGRRAASVAVFALALAPLACASEPTPPAAAPAAPPAAAFQQASGGVTAPQASPDDGVLFVEQEHKEPTAQDSAPATSLKADPSARTPKPNQQ